MVTDGYNDNVPSDNRIYANRKRTRVNYLEDNGIIGFGRVEFCFHASNDALDRTCEHFCKHCGFALQKQPVVDQYYFQPKTLIAQS